MCSINQIFLKILSKFMVFMKNLILCFINSSDDTIVEQFLNTKFLKKHLLQNCGKSSKTTENIALYCFTIPMCTKMEALTNNLIIYSTGGN